jgi:intracellular septation protein
MSLLIEFFPLLAFLAAYRWGGGIYPATIILMIAMVVSLGISWLRARRMPAIQAGSTALVLVFGAATLILRNARFIQWKPTVLMWLVAIAFLISAFVGEKPLAQRFLEPMLPDLKPARRDWLRVNVAWIVFGLFMGALNLFVVYRYTEAVWANFKVFGVMGAMFIFLFGQLLWLHRRAEAKP